MSKGRHRTSPYMLFGIIGAIVTAGVMIATSHYLRAKWAIAYLCGINAAVFFLYGYDKQAARISLLRVPEFVLHFFTFLGGTPFAFVSQQLFRHKTVKRSFRIVFWLVFVAQAVALWKLWPFLSSIGKH